jgi:hypothetical protein
MSLTLKRLAALCDRQEPIRALFKRRHQHGITRPCDHQASKAPKNDFLLSVLPVAGKALHASEAIATAATQPLLTAMAPPDMREVIAKPPVLLRPADTPRRLRAVPPDATTMTCKPWRRLP